MQARFVSFPHKTSGKSDQPGSLQPGRKVLIRGRLGHLGLLGLLLLEIEAFAAAAKALASPSNSTGHQEVPHPPGRHRSSQQALKVGASGSVSFVSTMSAGQNEWLAKAEDVADRVRS